MVRRLSAVLAAFFFISVSVVGQDVTGKIAGVITDPSGAAVPNALVTATNMSTNISRQGTTDNSGSYNICDSPPGAYRIEAQAPGFSKIVSTRQNRLEINKTMRV